MYCYISFARILTNKGSQMILSLTRYNNYLLTNTLFFIFSRVERWEAERSETPKSSMEEADKVMEKLRISSLKWHHLGSIDPFRARGFEAYLTPHQFKQQILKSFEISLTKVEVSIQLYSTSSSFSFSFSSLLYLFHLFYSS